MIIVLKGPLSGASIGIYFIGKSNDCYKVNYYRHVKSALLLVPPRTATRSTVIIGPKEFYYWFYFLV